MNFHARNRLRNLGYALPFVAASIGSGCVTAPHVAGPSYAPTDYSKFESKVALGPTGTSSRGTSIPTVDVWSWGYSFDSRRPNTPFILSCAINVAQDSRACTAFNGEMETQNPLNQFKKVRTRMGGVVKDGRVLFERVEGWEGPAEGWRVLPNGAAIYGRPIGLSAKECVEEGARQARAYHNSGAAPSLPGRTIGGVRNWCAELRY